MKKYIALALIPLMASCANCHKDRCQKQPEPAPLPVVYEEPMPMEVNPCACVNEEEPCREVKHPRISEEMPTEEPRRVCDDHQMLDCGCGNCDTFQNAKEPAPIYNPEFYEMPEPAPVQTYVPAQPEGYTLAANRAFNRFIKETYSIYGKNPNVKVFVENGVAKDADLPAGISSGVNTFKTQLANSHTFVLVDSPENADYILKTTAEWFDTPSSVVPAIKYITKLVSKDGSEAGVWSQVVKRADNKSWL